MKELNITQTELGRRMGVSQPTVAQMIDPDSDPKASTIFRIAEALGVSPYVVLDRYNVKKRQTENEQAEPKSIE
jgi:predicted transcriptional regulator